MLTQLLLVLVTEIELEDRLLSDDWLLIDDSELSLLSLDFV